MSKMTPVLIAVLCLGCGGASQDHGRYAKSAEPGDHQAVDAWAKSCLSGNGKPVEVAYETASGGAAVSFTTDGDRQALREHVLELARLHNSAEAQPESHSLRDLPHAANYEETDRGAKVTFVAHVPNDVDALRYHIQQDVLGMKSQGCQGAHEIM